MYIFHRRIWERVRNAFLSILITAAVIVMPFFIQLNIFELVLIILFAALLLPCSVFIAYKLISRKPALVIDDAGITINLYLLFVRTQFFSWSEIGRVDIYEKEIIHSGFVFPCVNMLIIPTTGARFSGASPNVVHRTAWGRLKPPYSFWLIYKGLDADAIRAAIKTHGKLRK